MILDLGACFVPIPVRLRWLHEKFASVYTVGETYTTMGLYPNSLVHADPADTMTLHADETDTIEKKLERSFYVGTSFTVTYKLKGAELFHPNLSFSEWVNIS